MQIFSIVLPFSITQPAKQLKNANDRVVLTVFEKTRVGLVQQLGERNKSNIHNVHNDEVQSRLTGNFLHCHRFDH